MPKRNAEAAGFPDVNDLNLELNAEVHAKLQQIYKTKPVKNGDVEVSTLNMLSDFDVQTQLEIVEDFGNSDFGKLIVPRDYHMRLTIRKKRKFVGKYNGLSDIVKIAIDELYEQKIVKLGDLDELCMDELGFLDEDQALRAIDNFKNYKYFSRVQNYSAFLMSKIKQVQKEAAIVSNNNFRRPFTQPQHFYNSGVNSRQPLPMDMRLHNRHNYGNIRNRTPTPARQQYAPSSRYNNNDHRGGGRRSHDDDRVGYRDSGQYNDNGQSSGGGQGAG